MAEKRGADNRDEDRASAGSSRGAKSKQGARERVAQRGADQRGDDAPDELSRRTRPATDRGGPEGVLTLVCLTCGNHKNFDDAPPPALTCER